MTSRPRVLLLLCAAVALCAAMSSGNVCSDSELFTFETEANLADLVTRWNQWSNSIPADTNPVSDRDGRWAAQQQPATDTKMASK